MQQSRGVLPFLPQLGPTDSESQRPGLLHSKDQLPFPNKSFSFGPFPNALLAIQGADRLDTTEGHGQLIEGTFYFSPNSSRTVCKPLGNPNPSQTNPSAPNDIFALRQP